MPLLVGRSGSVAALAAADNMALASGNPARLLLVAQRSAESESPGPRELYRTGTIVRVIQQSRMPNGAVRVLVEGVQRARVTRYRSSAGLITATVEPYEELRPLPGDDELMEAHARSAASLFGDYVAQSRRLPTELVPLLTERGSLQERAFGIAAHLPSRVADRQRMLEAASLSELFDLLARSLQSELELVGLERRIEQSVRASVGRNQREFYLNEQLKGMGGRLLPFNWLRLLRWMRRPHARTFRVPLMGVATRLQNSRLASQLAFMMIEYIRRSAVNDYGCERAEIGWILEDNSGMIAIAEAIGSKPNKEYRIYEKPL